MKNKYLEVCPFCGSDENTLEVLMIKDGVYISNDPVRIAVEVEMGYGKEDEGE